MHVDSAIVLLAARPSLSAYAMLGALAFGGFYLYSTSSASPVTKKASKVSSAPAPVVRKEESQQSGSDSVDLEWIPEHLKGQKPKAKKRSVK